MSEVENKNKTLFNDWISKKILLYGEKDFKKALEKNNPDYLPPLIKQEWFKYLKVKSSEKKIKNTSWLDRLNQSLKKNNITSIDEEVYRKIEFEENIQKKEKEFEISKKKTIDDYENKINLLKDLSDKSISSIKENFKNSEKDYQEKIKLLQSAYSSFKKDKENETKKLENSILEKEEIIKSINNQSIDYKEKTNFLESNNQELEDKLKLLSQEKANLNSKLNKNEIVLNNFNKTLEAYKKTKNEDIQYINKLQSKLLNQEKAFENAQIQLAELDKLKLKIKESNNVLIEYQEEIATYNNRIDESEETINHLLEKIVDLKEENFDYKEKLEELEKLKLSVEDSNNVIGDYEEKLAELEKIKRDLKACKDELIKSNETIKKLLDENNDLKLRFNKNNFEDITTYEINKDNSKIFTNETRNPKINTETFSEKVSFKIDQSKLERQKSEQKKIEEKIKEVESIEFDDDEIEDYENSEENINLYNQNQANESDNLTYNRYYQYLIKNIDENIDEDEEIDKETFSLFINQYSIDEDELIEEINTFCTERYDELLLEENNATNTFEISKEVFENFKLAFNYNDRN